MLADFNNIPALAATERPYPTLKEYTGLMYAKVTGKIAAAVNTGNATGLDADKLAAIAAHMATGFAATTTVAGVFFAANSNSGDTNCWLDVVTTWSSFVVVVVVVVVVLNNLILFPRTDEEKENKCEEDFVEEDFEEVRMVGVVLLLLLVVARGETLLTAEIEVVEGETMYQFYE